MAKLQINYWHSNWILTNTKQQKQFLLYLTLPDHEN